MNNKHNNNKITLNKLFPHPPSCNFDNLMIDNECLSYITTPINADIITAIIVSLIPNNTSLSNITIFDATACIGGNTISFAKIFGIVVASEINRHRYNMLINNLKEFELDNVICINADCTQILDKFDSIDIIYFDPPWGGKKYKEQEKLRLSIGNMYIDEIINIIFKNKTKLNVKMVVLKLPKNYDFKLLYETTKILQLIVLMYKLSKMIIIVFKKKFI